MDPFGDRANIQSVVFVYLPWGDDGPTPQEAIEVVFQETDGLPPVEVLAEARSLAEGLPHEFEARFQSGEWGATFPVYLEVLIGVGEGIGGGMITAWLLSLASRRSKKKPERAEDLPPLDQEIRSAPRTSDEAWEVFKQLMRKAFRAAGVRAEEISENKGGWSIQASDKAGERYVGSVTRNGRIVKARRR